MRYEIFTLGKHFLQVHTSKGFTLFANAKLNPNGEVVSYTDTLVRRGGSWVIDCYKFLTVKEFPQNPIYCAVFGFEEDDEEVRVNATDIDVESISGVNGQLVDVGNISLPPNQSLAVNQYGGREVETLYVEYDKNFTPLNLRSGLGMCVGIECLFKWSPSGLNSGSYGVNGFKYKMSFQPFSEEGWGKDVERTIYQILLSKESDVWYLTILTDRFPDNVYPLNNSSSGCKIPCSWLYSRATLIFYQPHKVVRVVF